MSDQTKGKELSAFYLVPRYNNRELYKAVTGKEAKPFDYARPPQYWELPVGFDLSSVAGLVQAPGYLIFPYAVVMSPSKTAKLQRLVVAVASAYSVNLPPSNVVGDKTVMSETQVPLDPALWDSNLYLFVPPMAAFPVVLDRRQDPVEAGVLTVKHLKMLEEVWSLLCNGGQ